MSLETALGIAEDGKIPHARGSQVRAVTWPTERSPFLHRTRDRCPTDRRIEGFLNDHLGDLNLESPLRLPSESLVLSRHGIARELTIPEGANSYRNPHLLPRAKRRPAQPAQRSPYDSGDVPHRRGRLADSR